MVLSDYVGDYYGRRRHKGTFGIEIEVEGKNLPEAPKDWVGHKDGSLRGEALEYVFARPLSMEDSVKALEALEEAFIENNSECLMSPRTSVHVHYNVFDFQMQRLYTAICLWFLFENMLVRYSGPTREGNNFCLRISDVEMLVLDIRTWLKNTAFFGNFGDNHRYAAINLAAINKFCSVEFRSFRGTTNKEEIIEWIELIDNIMQGSKEFNSPIDIVDYYCIHGIEKIMAKVLPEKFINWVQTHSDWERQILNNMRYVIEIAFDGEDKWIDDLEAKAPKMKYEFAENVVDPVLRAEPRVNPLPQFNPINALRPAALARNEFGALIMIDPEPEGDI